jgi:hypothetical protein
MAALNGLLAQAASNLELEDKTAKDPQPGPAIFHIMWS